MKFIHWNILSGVKHLTIYDPFSEFDETNLTIFITSLEEFFNKNFSILFTYHDTIHDSRKKDNILKEGYVKTETYNIIISLVNFKSSNSELIDKVLSIDANSGSLPLPKQMVFYNDIKYSSFQHKITQNEYEKYYTKKNEDYLPSIIFCFSEQELCLFGFPFTLLENAEIIKSGSLASFSVTKYINLIEQFNKIDKRFGK